jgi:antiphage defense system Thoeris ThsB-like protein
MKIVANPRAFVSFDFDHDEISRRLFVGQAKENSPTPFVIADWSSKLDLPQDQWEKIIEDKINRCHLMIVLVGRYMGSATGVAKEIQFARDGNVPFFGVYVDGAGTTSVLPAGLARNRVIRWAWPGVAVAINQMMSEGKNA